MSPLTILSRWWDYLTGYLSAMESAVRLLLEALSPFSKVYLRNK
jgi:hypothetical protein